MSEKKSFAKTVKEVASAPAVKLPNHEMLYVPILKGKAGELGALSELTNEVKSKVFPIIEIPEVPWDYVNERYAKTTSEHVKGFLKKLVDCWGVNYPVVIDMGLVDEDMGGGNNVADHILSDLHQRGIEAIPVIRFGDSETYLNSLIPHFEDVKRACLRVDSDDINDLDLNAEIPALLGRLGLSHGDIDLLLDFKDLKSDQEKIYANVVKMSINNAIPDIGRFNSLTVAMTSFPENLSDHDANTMEEFA